MIGINKVRQGKQSLYKGRYTIYFYSKDGETFIKSFDNVRQIIEHRHLPVTRTRINQFNVELYRALRTEDHLTLMLDGKHYYSIWLLDLDEDYDTDYILIDVNTNKYVDREFKLTDDKSKAGKFAMSDIQTILCKCVDTPFYIVELKESDSATTSKRC